MRLLAMFLAVSVALPALADEQQKTILENICCEHEFYIGRQRVCSSFEVSKKEQTRLSTQYKRAIQLFPKWLKKNNEPRATSIQPNEYLLICLIERERSFLNPGEAGSYSGGSYTIELTDDGLKQVPALLAHEMFHHLYNTYLERSGRAIEVFGPQAVEEAKAMDFESFYGDTYKK